MFYRQDRNQIHHANTPTYFAQSGDAGLLARQRRSGRVRRPAMRRQEPELHVQPLLPSQRLQQGHCAAHGGPTSHQRRHLGASMSLKLVPKS